MIRQATAADAPAIARVHGESWRTTYGGIVPDKVLANLSVERREQQWARILGNPEATGFVCVAADKTGTIIGFASGGPEREHDPVYTGELYAIYLLAEAQGKGMGRTLTQLAAERLAAAGHQAMLVWVLAANPSCHFYAALGGTPIREKPVTIGDATLTEVAYGWRDIRLVSQRGTKE